MRRVALNVPEERDASLAHASSVVPEPRSLPRAVEGSEQLPAHVFAVIVHHSGTEFLRTRARLREYGYEVDVVCTHSGECGSGRAIKNVGYGTAINYAIKTALMKRPDGNGYIVLALNDDVWLDLPPSALAAVNSRDHWIAGVGADTGHVERVPFPELGALLRWYLGRATGGDSFPKGYALAAPLRTLASLGGFDPRFFLYYEEADLYLRAISHGYPIREIRAREAIHAGSSSTSQRSWVSAVLLGMSGGIYARKHYHGLRLLSVTLTLLGVPLAHAIRFLMSFKIRTSLQLIAQELGVLIGVAKGRESSRVVHLIGGESEALRRRALDLDPPSNEASLGPPR